MELGFFFGAEGVSAWQFMLFCSILHVASCCQPPRAEPGSKSSVWCWAGRTPPTSAVHEGGLKPMTPALDHAAVSAARRRAVSGWPSKCATSWLPTSGCRWWIISKQSAQLAQRAESRKREALRRRSPPKSKGKWAISLPFLACSIW